MPRQRWRILVTPAAAGAETMALDEALMSRARQADEWTLRVYAWSAPTISLGRNQPALRHYDRDRIRRHGMTVVRRPTGGRAILHHREITYSVTAPAAAAGPERESYARINRLLVTALNNLGVDARVAPRQAEVRNEDAAVLVAADDRAAGAQNEHGFVGLACVQDQKTHRCHRR